MSTEELSPRSLLLRAVTAALCLAGCAPGLPGGPGERTSPTASEVSGAAASSAPQSSSGELGPKVFGRAARATWDLFSPDGRFIILDDIVIDLETRTVIPFDCDLGHFAWYSGPRVACVVPTHEALAVLDLRDRQLRTLACDASALRDQPLIGSTHFAIWVDEHRTTSTVVDIETGSSYLIPGPAVSVWEEGGRTVAMLSKVVQADGNENQLWDVVRGKPIGEPYVWQNGLHAVSPNGRWAFGANRTEGQFIVDLKTGARRAVGAADEIPNVAFYLPAPFSPDSANVAIAAAGSGVRIVELSTGAVLATLIAAGCETAISVKFGPKADVLVVGGDQSNVCVFDLKGTKLVWRADLRGRTDFTLGAVHRRVDDPSRHVRALEFTRDGEGIVATGDTGSSRGWGVLLRATTGEILTSFPETKYMWRDADGDLLTTAFLFGPQLAVTPRTAEGRSNLGCEAPGPPLRSCLKGRVPEPAPWQDAYILSVDAKGQRVAGVVGERLRVWSVTGEVLFGQ